MPRAPLLPRPLGSGDRANARHLTRIGEDACAPRSGGPRRTSEGGRMSTNIEEQLRAAIHEQVAEVSDSPDRWADIETAAAAARRRAVTRRRAFASLALAAAIIVGLATVAVVHGMSTNKVVVKPSGRGIQSPATPSAGPTTVALPITTAPTTIPPTPTTAPTSGAVAPLTSASTPSITLPPPVAFPYQPMWPFRTQQEAIAWQADDAAGGHQPWHLDAGQTALSFTQGYLGFTDIDTVVNVRIDGTEAQDRKSVG